MRVIAGRFRGRKLTSFKADHIRPTTDRVKESIFNKLQADVSDSRVLDLFSGTGSLACEAVSRGAAWVDAVEMNKKSIAIIRKNLKLLEIENEVRIHAEDVLKYLRHYEGEPYDLILIDPPFTDKLAHSVLVELSSSQVLGSQTIVVIESSSHETVLDFYEGLERLDERDYGDKKVTYWQRAR
jgi:16S rRNA (guanine966-N2)-methyltransferase